MAQRPATTTSPPFSKPRFGVRRVVMIEFTRGARQAGRVLDIVGRPGVPAFDAAVLAFEQRGADGLDHARGSFLSHLISTANILRAWGAAPEVCLAGLAHSAYGTAQFTTALFKASERDALASLIGPRAEHLAHVFGRYSRSKLWHAFSAGTLGTSETAVELEDRTTKTSFNVTRQDAVDLALVELANVFEQRALQDSNEEALLPRCGPLARAIRSDFTQSIFFESLCMTEFTAEPEARAVYAAGLAHYDDDPDLAAMSFARVTQLLPFAAEPRLLLASIALQNDDAQSASAHAGRAFEAAIAMGTSWDKAIPWAQTVQSALELENEAGETRRHHFLEELRETSTQ